MDEAKCFGEGADARIRGESLTANPYYGDKGGFAWVQGYMHVQKWWGRDVQRRTFKPLPPVRETA